MKKIFSFYSSIRFSLLLIFAFLFSAILHADPENDSLKKAFHTQRNDSLRISAAITICMNYSSDMPDTCIVYADSALSYCKINHLDQFVPVLLKLKGVAYVNLSKYKESLESYLN